MIIAVYLSTSVSDFSLKNITYIYIPTIIPYYNPTIIQYKIQTYLPTVLFIAVSFPFAPPTNPKLVCQSFFSFNNHTCA